MEASLARVDKDFSDTHRIIEERAELTAGLDQKSVGIFSEAGNLQEELHALQCELEDNVARTQDEVFDASQQLRSNELEAKAMDDRRESVEFRKRYCVRQHEKWENVGLSISCLWLVQSLSWYDSGIAVPNTSSGQSRRR